MWYFFLNLTNLTNLTWGHLSKSMNVCRKRGGSYIDGPRSKRTTLRKDNLRECLYDHFETFPIAVIDIIHQYSTFKHEVFSNGSVFAERLVDGTVKTWGASRKGCNGPKDLKNVNMIYSTHAAFTAVMFDKTLRTWGHPDYGGKGPSNLQNVETIYSTNCAFAAVLTDGTVRTWGNTQRKGNPANFNM